MDDAVETRSEAERSAILQQVIAQQVARNRGVRIEPMGPTQAVLVSGKRTNHILHLLLSVFTVGFWLPIWLIIALSNSGERRQVITVDAWGRVAIT